MRKNRESRDVKLVVFGGILWTGLFKALYSSFKIYIYISIIKQFVCQYCAVYFDSSVWCRFIAVHLMCNVCIWVQQEASVQWGFIISINLNYKELDSPRVAFMALINKILSSTLIIFKQPNKIYM